MTQGPDTAAAMHTVISVELISVPSVRAGSLRGGILNRVGSGRASGQFGGERGRVSVSNDPLAEDTAPNAIALVWKDLRVVSTRQPGKVGQLEVQKAACHLLPATKLQSCIQPGLCL